jgi:hypothetical protein
LRVGVTRPFLGLRCPSKANRLPDLGWGSLLPRGIEGLVARVRRVVGVSVGRSLTTESVWKGYDGGALDLIPVRYLPGFGVMLVGLDLLAYLFGC